MLEETYLKIISAKTAELFAAATKVGAILSEMKTKEKEALENSLKILQKSKNLHFSCPGGKSSFSDML